MKKKSSICALALSVVMAMSVFASCSSSNGSSATSSGSAKPEHKNISAMVCQSRNFPGLKKMGDKLATDENITLDIQVIPDDQYDNLLKMKLNSGEAADLIDFNMPTIAGYLGTPEKYIVDLTNEEWTKKLLTPDRFKNDGKIWGYPFTDINGFQTVIYNKDAFAKAGITEEPKTKDEFNEDCKKIKAAGISPILLPKDTWVPQIWMTSGYAQLYGSDEAAEEFSQKLFKNEDKLTNHPEMAAVVDDFVSNIKNGYVNDDFMTVSHDACIERLAKGEGAMYYNNGVAIVTAINKSFPDANIGMFVYPGEFNKNATTAVAPFSAGFSIFKDSKEVETAKKVLNLFSNPEYADLYYTEGNAGFPALQGVNGGDIPKVTLDFYNAHIKDGKGVSEMNSHWSTIKSLQSQTLFIYYQQAAQGKMSGADVLARYQEDINKFMKEQKAPGF